MAGNCAWIPGSGLSAATLTCLAPPEAPGVSTAVPLLRRLRAVPVSAGFPAQGPRCALLLPCAVLIAVRLLAVAVLPAVPGAGPEPSRAGAGGRAQRERPGWARPL